MPTASPNDYVDEEMSEEEVVERMPGDNEVFVSQSEDKHCILYRTYADDGSLLGTGRYFLDYGFLELFEDSERYFISAVIIPEVFDWAEDTPSEPADVPDMYGGMDAEATNEILPDIIAPGDVREVDELR